MASVFTRIISGELPGRFVWRDERCVAFLTIEPLNPGHTLVVPRREIDDWLDLEPELMYHLAEVAQSIGKAIQRGFNPAKVGMMIAGLEVPHVHIHVLPIWSMQDFDVAKVSHNPRSEDLDAAAETIRDRLRRLGYPQVSE